MKCQLIGLIIKVDNFKDSSENTTVSKGSGCSQYSKKFTGIGFEMFGMTVVNALQ